MPVSKKRSAPILRASDEKNKKPSGTVRRRYTDGNAPPGSAEKASKTAKPVKSLHRKAKSAKVTQEHTVQESPPNTPATPANEKREVCTKWFKRITDLGLRGIRREFIEKVRPYKPDLSTSAFKDEANTEKNRYDDVLLLDKSRVRIQINPENDDYIHASTVEATPDLTYICAQGPLTNTVHQFWLMCIQEDVRVILQLCQNVEDEKEKCSDYCPTTKDVWETYGPVQVKLIDEGTSVSGTKKVTKSTLQCKFGDKTLTCTHLLYYGWPDHSVPESVETCREVRALVHKLYEKKPIVVHCSAGIGRTGTFVAIDMVCHKLLNEKNGKFSMIDLMKKLRDQRMNAIQNDQQYACIFRIVVDILIAEDALSKTGEVTRFIDDYEGMVARKQKTRRHAD